LDNRLTFRSGVYDFAPREAKKMYALLSQLADQGDSEGVRQEAKVLVKAFRDRTRLCPSALPNEFILVHAPTPLGHDLDDWMRQHSAQLEAVGGSSYKIPYADYSAHPIRHVRRWAAKQINHGCYVYVVPHRKAKLRYDGVHTISPAPFALHYNMAFPVFHTIDLAGLQVVRGPYAGQRVLDLFHEGPGVFLVKQSWYSHAFVQECRHRAQIVYATWLAHLTPPYATWRGRT